MTAPKWRYFSAQELACRCGQPDCPQQPMHPDFMHRLDRLRLYLGRPLVVVSGYRCPAYNQRVATTGPQGPHTTGRAVDIAVNGMLTFQLLGQAIGLGFTGFGLKQSGDPAARFVHLDDLGGPDYPRPRVWTY